MSRIVLATIGSLGDLHPCIALGLELRRRNHHSLRLRYAPYGQVFPTASAIVHQGGSGTTGRALKAGRPMVFVPYGWDQPDNGARVERLGAGLTIARARYTAERSAAVLARLLEEPGFRANAAILGGKIQKEDGLTRACDAVELVLSQLPVPFERGG